MTNILLNIFSPIILPYKTAFPQADGALISVTADTPLSAGFFLKKFFLCRATFLRGTLFY